MSATSPLQERVAGTASPRALRIVHVTSNGTLCGGAERLVAELAACQRANGHEVLVLSGDQPGDGARFSDRSWQVRSSRWRRARDTLTNHSARALLADVVQQWRPDVVHLHIVGLLSPRALVELAGVPTVMTVHGPELFLRPTLQWCLPSDYFVGRARLRGRLTLRSRFVAMPAFWLIGWMWRRHLRVVDVFAAPSRYLARLAERELGPTVVVPNGGSPSWSAVARTPGTSRPRPSSRAGRRSRIVFAGRLEDFKGPQVLVAAMPAILAEHPDTLLSVCGSGPLAEPLQRLVVDYGLEKSVELVGWLGPDDLAAVLETADVAVVPSVVPESFGLTCLEALAAGVPVVASAVGGLPDLVRHEQTGLLVPPEDVPALALAVNRLLADPALRDRLVAAGRRLTSRFTLEAHVAAVAELYEQAIEQHRRRTASRSGSPHATP